jgi:hypothetical protein
MGHTEALDFYLNNRTGTILEDLSVAKGFEISQLAETYGADSVLKVLNDLGTDPSAADLLRASSQDTLDLYFKGYDSPGSVLQDVSVQDGLRILDGQVVEIDPALAPDLASRLADLTGRDAWGSQITGEVYSPESSARAWAAADRSTAYQLGRFIGSLLGIVQGAWEIASGIATATGGTVISCGTVILCFVGGGAAVLAGSAVAVHGAVVAGVSVVNVIDSGRALFSSAHSGSGGGYEAASSGGPNSGT